MDVWSKADALLTKTAIRILVTGERKLVSYWLGGRLRGLFPHMIWGPNAEKNCSYWNKLGELLEETKELFLPRGCQQQMPSVTADGGLTNAVIPTVKNIYALFTGTFPPVAVSIKRNVEGGWDRVWKRQVLPVLGQQERDNMFRVLHDLCSTWQRMWRMNQVPDPFCPKEATKVMRAGPVDEKGRPWFAANCGSGGFYSA